MAYPFINNHRRILGTAFAALMLTTTLSGCFGSGSLDQQSSTPPNLVDTQPTTEPTTEPTTSPSTETTAPQETLGENMAVVKEQANLRSIPSMDGKAVGQLDAGEIVEVERIHTLGGIDWAYVPSRGWIPADMLDMSNVTVGNDDNTTTPGSTAATESGATTAPTTSTNTGTGTTLNGSKGVVTASELNVRSEPSTTGERQGSLKYGDRVTITEKQNGWGKVSNGWISLDYVYMDGTTGANSCKGLVTGSELNVRSGPGTNYDRVSSVKSGDRIQVLERIKLGNTTWGCIKEGWISMDYVYVDGTTGEGSGTGTVTGTNVNVRSGPGTNYDAVSSVTTGDTVKVYAQFKFGNTYWGCIDKGWVCMDYVSMG